MPFSKRTARTTPSTKMGMVCLTSFKSPIDNLFNAKSFCFYEQLIQFEHQVWQKELSTPPPIELFLTLSFLLLLSYICDRSIISITSNILCSDFSDQAGVCQIDHAWTLDWSCAGRELLHGVGGAGGRERRRPRRRHPGLRAFGPVRTENRRHRRRRSSPAPGSASAPAREVVVVRTRS